MSAFLPTTSDWTLLASDPFMNRVLTSWIAQYLRIRQSNQALAESLHSQLHEMEMIPIPKSIIAYMREPGVNQAILEKPYQSATAEHLAQSATLRVAALDSAKASKLVHAAIERFAEAFEKNDSAALATFIADDYFDFIGRDKNAIVDAIATIIKEITPQKVVVMEPAQVQIAGRKILAIFPVSWRGKTGPRSTTLEVIFDQTDSGLKACSIQSR